ncbi:MAG: sigma-70 family RNA polymerase sigma factor [Oscillospiraceae bacterium]|nr:sigma-70 family RNA polymerase sigma factor [Oscillospiraceae bacterium]
MKTKYYQYNKSGGEKYSEFTEEEYLIAKTYENRWFISFGNCVLECSKDEYRAYYSEKNHADYTQRDKNGKIVIPLSLEQYAHNTCQNLIFRDFEEEILEKIMAKEMLERLHTALKKLKPCERNIIHKLFWENKNQTQLADEYGITQQTMHEKITRVLAKLLKFIKNEK